MIYTLTPNPALDTSAVVDKLVTDEKNYVQHVVHYPGGNGINVARMLKRMNVKECALGFLGGAAGDDIQRILDLEKVASKFIPIQDATRSSFTITQLLNHRQTRLSFPGPNITANEAKKLDRQVASLKGRYLFMLGGSFPKNFSIPQVKGLISIVRQRNAPIAVDCPPKLLKKLLSIRPTLIKPNVFEFQELMGRRFDTVESVAHAAQTLLGQVPMVCVSSVHGGAVLATRQGCWYGKGELPRTRSTVGAGDSMVAGMLSRLAENELYASDQLRKEIPRADRFCPEMLTWGIACGMSTAARPTGHLGDFADVLKYLKKIRVKRVA